MKKTLIAAATAAMVTATGAVAMDNELTMLEQAVSNRFAAIGIDDFDMGSLTLQELSEIRAVLASNDYNRNQKKQQVEAILNR